MNCPSIVEGKDCIVDATPEELSSLEQEIAPRDIECAKKHEKILSSYLENARKSTASHL